MVVNKLKFPGLRLLDGKLPCSETKVKQFIHSNEGMYNSYCAVMAALWCHETELCNNINYITDSVFETIGNNDDVIAQTFKTEAIPLTPSVYLYSDGTVAYIIPTQLKTPLVRNEDTIKGHSDEAVFIVVCNDKGEFIVCTYGCITKLEKTGENILEMYGEVTENVYLLMTTHIFLHYAKTEVEYIDNCENRIICEHDNKKEKFQNYSGYNVKYISSNWYKEIIRTEGFNVRGHMRLQPYKDCKKLIFIAPFAKHGYHRRAQKDII